MNPTLATAIKRGLLRTGRYRRLLARATFPGVVVLGYHGLRGDHWPEGTMAFENLHVRAGVFAEHCALIRGTCHPITLDQWRLAINGRGTLPERPVLITFDDGYRSVHTIAAPILRRYGLPAVVFACSEPMERRRLLWFDHVAARDGEAAVDAWKERPYEEWLACVATSPQVGDDDPGALMTPAELRALSGQEGIEIGAHTARHPILARASAARQREEIAESRDALATWTGRPVKAFAYPNGRPALDYSDETLTILRDLGFDIAFTMRPSFARPAEPPLEHSRLLILAEVTAAEMAHRLAFTWPR